MESRLRKAVEKQNALAMDHLHPEPHGREVRVIQAGRYNGPGHRSLGWCEEGMVIVVAGGWYANSLIEDGFVTDQIRARTKRRRKT